jgi:hypothetical protein
VTKRALALLATATTVVGLASLRPTSAAAVPLPPQPVETNAKVPITLLSQSKFVDTNNQVHVVGELQNSGSATAEFVSLAVDEYDAGGSLLGTDSTFADVSVLSPGQRSGFIPVIVDLGAKPGFDHAVVTTIDDRVATDPQNQWFTTTVNAPTTDSGGQHIVGTVRNLNSTASQFVTVLFTFLDANGQAVDTDATIANTDSSATVQPGATVGFIQLDRDPTAPAWTSYEVVAESSTAPAVGQRLSTQVYRDLLGREGDGGGLAYWAGLIDGGQLRYHVAESLTSSTEYRGQQVQAQYLKYLGRPTDGTLQTGGEGFWIGYIAGGRTLEQLGESLIASNEYFATKGQGTNAGYVDALYHDILGRGPETTYWVGQLDSGTPRWVVSTAILSSTEAYHSLINGIFQQYLRHLPDAPGLDFWVGQAQGGMRDELVVASIMASNEYLTYAVGHTG